MSLFPYGWPLWQECTLAQLREPLENAMRPVGGVWPYLGRPCPLFRFYQPSCAAGHVGRVNGVHGRVPRHPRGVGRLEPVSGAAVDAGGLQNIRHMLGVIDTIELILQLSGDIHLDEVYIVCHGVAIS